MPNRSAEKPSDDGVKSVSRALAVLEALAEGSCGLVEIAAQTGLPPSTAHRLLATLVSSGFVARTGFGEYRLDANAALLGVSASRGASDYERVLQPFLARIRRVAGKTANLFGFDGGRVVLMRQLPTSAGVGLKLRPGMTLPIHATASGKACFAHLDEELAAERLASLPLTRLTPRTHVDSSSLLREFEWVRELGFAVSHREYSEDLSAIGAPILDPGCGRVLGALTVSLTGMDRARLGKAETEELGELVSVAALDGSAALAAADISFF